MTCVLPQKLLWCVGRLLPNNSILLYSWKHEVVAYCDEDRKLPFHFTYVPLRLSLLVQCALRILTPRHDLLVSKHRSFSSFVPACRALLSSPPACNHMCQCYNVSHSFSHACFCTLLTYQRSGSLLSSYGRQSFPAALPKISLTRRETSCWLL